MPQLAPIAPPFAVFPYPPWMVVCVALVVLLCVGGVIWLVWKRIQKARAHRALDPRQRALAALAALTKQIGRLEPKAFGIAVCDVLRRFLSEAFSLPATRQTSLEFLTAAMGNPRFSPAQRRFLELFLEKTDLLKFARLESSRAESESLLQEATAFVKESAA